MFSRSILYGVVLIFTFMHIGISQKLTLNDALKRALKENYDVHIAYKTADKTYSGILAKNAVFDWVLSANADFTDNQEEPVSTILAGSRTRTWNSDIGLAKKFFFGSLFELKLSSDKTHSGLASVFVNPYWDTAATLSVTHPL